MCAGELLSRYFISMHTAGEQGLRICTYTCIYVHIRGLKIYNIEYTTLCTLAIYRYNIMYDLQMNIVTNANTGAIHFIQILQTDVKT